MTGIFREGWRDRGSEAQKSTGIEKSFQELWYNLYE